MDLGFRYEYGLELRYERVRRTAGGACRAVMGLGADLGFGFGRYERIGRPERWREVRRMIIVPSDLKRTP